MRALLLALVLTPSLAFADQENVYEFDFTGAISDVPFDTTDPSDAKFVPFTVTFFANSPTLPFPAKGQPYFASVSAYDVNVVINGQTVEQVGIGGFGFSGTDQEFYDASPGGGVYYIGTGWGFSSDALSWGLGSPDFGLPFPDPLNGANYTADNGEAGCFVPPATDTSGPVLCEMSGVSHRVGPVTAPEPQTLALFALGLAGLALTRRRSHRA